MTAFMDSSGIPWFLTEKTEYSPVSIERWYGVLSKYRTVEKSYVHTDPLNLLG